MVEFRDKLKEMGHDAIIHPIYEDLAAGKLPDLMSEIQNDEEHANVKKRFDFIKWYFNSIASSDAILVLNFDKNGIKNYVGGNTLMEMVFAHVNDKKIFLLNPIPRDVSYFEEIKAMADAVLDGDLNKII